MVKKFTTGNLAIYSLAISSAELTLGRRAFLITELSTLALEATKIEAHRFKLNCRYCTSYRFYHIGSIMAKMLLKQN